MKHNIRERTDLLSVPLLLYVIDLDILLTVDDRINHRPTALVVLVAVLVSIRSNLITVLPTSQYHNTENTSQS